MVVAGIGAVTAERSVVKKFDQHLPDFEGPVAGIVVVARISLVLTTVRPGLVQS